MECLVKQPCSNLLLLLVTAAGIGGSSTRLPAADHLVGTPEEISKALQAIRPGDTAATSSLRRPWCAARSDVGPAWRNAS